MRLNKPKAALTLLSVCGVASTMLGGCVENRTTLYIDSVLAYIPGEDCELEVSLESTKLIGGTWDPAGSGGYVLPLLIANGLQPLGDNDTLRPETSRITLEGAEIGVEAATGGNAVPAFTVPMTGTIYPDDSEDPGLMGAQLGLPLGGLGLGAGTYDVAIVVFGTTHGGLSVESSEFRFPITVTSPGAYGVCQGADLDEDAFHPCYPSVAQDLAPAYICEDFGVTVGNCASCP